MEVAEQQYNLFKECGDLKVLFPRLSGDWERDKKAFTKIWENNKKILEDIENEDND